VFWPQFVPILDRLWRPGPPDWPNTHMAVVGQTRSGKSTFVREIMQLRERVVMFGTKMVDEPLYGPLIKQGYQLVEEWDPAAVPENPREPVRVIFRPVLKGPEEKDIAVQREAFRRALVRAWQVGGWTMWFDEVAYLSETLKLKSELDLLWLQGGSGGLTLVALTQRPVEVPRNMWAQSRFLVSFRIGDLRDRQTMSEHAGAQRPMVEWVAGRLERRELLFLDQEMDIALRTRVELSQTANGRGTTGA
jgi:hypothetical protein